MKGATDVGGSCSGRLRTLLLIWTGLTFLPAWLVTVRGLLEGDDYAWGVNETFSGRGTSGSYVACPAAAIFGLCILSAGWRGVMRPFHVLLAGWHIPLGIAASVAAIRSRETLRLRGDTLGIDVSLAPVAPVVLAVAAAGSVALAVIDNPATTAARRRRPNHRRLGVALVIAPLQLLLFRAGAQHGLTDKLGVILTIGQWLLINVSLAGKPVSPVGD